MDEPKESERRLRGHERGIEAAYRIEKGGKVVLVVLFDVRYGRDSDHTIDIEQWKWFKNVIE